jgi:hypothetical protein
MSMASGNAAGDETATTESLAGETQTPVPGVEWSWQIMFILVDTSFPFADRPFRPPVTSVPNPIRHL